MKFKQALATGKGIRRPRFQESDKETDLNFQMPYSRFYWFQAKCEHVLSMVPKELANATHYAYQIFLEKEDLDATDWEVDPT